MGKEAGVKVITRNIIPLICPIVLAYWIIGDGNYSANGLILNTQSYTLSEVKTIQEALESRFYIKTTVHKNKGTHVIYIGVRNIEKIRELVRPLMHSSKYYKIDRR